MGEWEPHMDLENGRYSVTPIAQWLLNQFGNGKRFRSARQMSEEADLNPNAVKVIIRRGRGEPETIRKLAEAAEVADRIIIISEGSVIAKGRPGDLAAAYLDGEMIYRVGFRGNKEELQGRLDSLDLMIRVECVGFQAERIRWELRVKSHVTEEDLLGVFEGMGLKPFEFYKKELKLEDVFVKALTRETAS